MKTTLKVLVTVALMIAAVAWAITSILPRSFGGTQLTFAVGGGSVQIDNPTTLPIAIQLTGTGSRTFTVSSIGEQIAGTSTRQGSGSTATQLFETTLPPGMSEFRVLRGNNVQFVSSSDSALKATVMPLSEGDARTTLIVAGLVILGGLYVISGSTGHRWIARLRRPAPVPVPVVPSEPETPVDPNRGHDGRMYSNYGTKD